MYVSGLLTLCPRSLDGTPECVLPHFHEAAEQLIKKKGATNVVAAALAYIWGEGDSIKLSVYLPGMFFIVSNV